MNLHESKELRNIIEKCCLKDSRAQYELFRYCYPFAMGVCSRFAGCPEEANEVLNEGFLKVFIHINKYSFDLSFGGWIRKIMVNTAIDHYRKRKIYKEEQLDISHYKEMADTEVILSGLHSEDILHMVQKLPPSYRIVFTLYVVEEFTHKEIAEKLGITEGTSKSNLAKARLKLQKELNSIETSSDSNYGQK